MKIFSKSRFISLKIRGSRQNIDRKGEMKHLKIFFLNVFSKT